MTKMIIEGKLQASDLNNRILSYKLLPFGEPGATNLGRVTWSKGTVALPSNPGDLILNIQHDADRPVGRAVMLAEKEDGIYGDFKIAPTSDGDDLLIEAAEGLRTGISVETEPTVIRGGIGQHAVLTGAGAVTKPAFPSAQLMVAADCGDLPPQGGTMADQAPQAAPVAVTPTPAAPAAPAATPVAPAPVATLTPEEEELQRQSQLAPTAMAAAMVPVGLQPPTSQVKATDRAHDLVSVSKMLASMAEQHGAGGSRMLAALSAVATATTLDIVTPESFEGKVWQGREYQQKYIPLTETEALTKLRYRGWAWKAGKKPVMAAYAGFPNEPSSGAVEAELREFEPDLYAGAWSMDRKHRDFSDPEFWSEFFIATSTSYAQVTDLAHLDALVAAATEVTLDLGDKPADVPQGLWQVVKGVRSNLPKGISTFAVMDFDLWEEVVFTPQDKVLPYLQLAMGVEEGQVMNFKFLPSEDLNAGEVLVGVKQAAKHRELPGAAPIRVDAEVISKGGFEQGVFGYAGTAIREPGALALVTATA